MNKQMTLQFFITFILTSQALSASIAFATDTSNCDDVCAKMIKNEKGKWIYYGLEGRNNGKWSDSPDGDDAWCSAHGQATNSVVYPNNNSYVMTEVEKKDKIYPRRIEQCTLRNSQVSAQCQAWATADSANTMDKVLMAIDTAAAVVCGVECAAEHASGGTGAAVHAAISVCKITGISAGVLELADVLFQSEESGTMRTAQGAIAVAGAVGTTGTTLFMGARSTTKNLNPCLSTAAFVGLAGIRAYSIHDHGVTKKAACEQVRSLWSTSTVANANTSGAGGNGTFGSGNGNVSTSGARSAGYSTSSTGAGYTPEYGAILSDAKAATDGGILYNTPLGNAAVEAAPSLDIGKIQSDIAAGKSPGQAISEAVGSSSPSTSSLFAESDKAIRDYLKKEHAVEGTSYAAGSGGSKTEASSGFGGFERAPAAFGGQTDVAFKGSRSMASDIWHTGTSLNLFQIVSGKIEKVSSPLVK